MSNLPIELRTADDAKQWLSVSSPQVAVVTIYPVAATALLDANTRNRRLNERRKNMHASNILADRFRLTNDAITLDTDATLVNDQHRLAAAEETEQPIPVTLLAGVEPETRDVLDTGMRRTFGQALQLRGETNYYRLAAAIGLHFRYEHDLLRAGRRVWNGLVFNTGEPIGQAILIEHLETNPQLRTAVSTGDRIHFHLPDFRNSAAAVLSAVTTAVDPYESEAFVERLAKGEGLESGEPELSLRNLLIRAHGDLTTEYQLGAGIKAWNARRRGRELRTISLREAESFPRAQ